MVRLSVPAGTPRRSSRGCQGKHGDSAQRGIQERLKTEGLEVVANSPDEFVALIKSDIEKWTKLVKTIGMSLL